MALFIFINPLNKQWNVCPPVYICILQGQSPLDVANQKRNKWLIDKLKRMRLEKGFDNIGVFQRKTTNNKVWNATG